MTAEYMCVCWLDTSSASRELLWQARNTMSMARRLRTQDNEIVALQRVKRELEQEKQTHLKMIASRDDRIRHLDSQAERHCRSDSMNKSQTPSPHRLSPFQVMHRPLCVCHCVCVCWIPRQRTVQRMHCESCDLMIAFMDE